MKKLPILLALFPLLASCGGAAKNEYLVHLDNEAVYKVEKELKSETIYSYVTVCFIPNFEKGELKVTPQNFVAKKGDQTVNSECFIDGISFYLLNEEQHWYANALLNEFSKSFEQTGDVVKTIVLDVAFPSVVDATYTFHYASGNNYSNAITHDHMLTIVI